MAFLNYYESANYKQAATIFPERCDVEFRFVDSPADPASWDQEIDARVRDRFPILLPRELMSAGSGRW